MPDIQPARRPSLAELPPRVDLVVVGGGITGAGVLAEARRSGASVLLVEQNDFASGTSSASSKLVHGGLRYLRTGQWRLTLESVRERQRLLLERPGLVETQSFLMPIYRGARPGKLAMTMGLRLYDRMAGRRASRWLDAQAALELEPAIRSHGLLGAMLYDDARTDDARLVLRLIFDAVAAGALARNYTEVNRLLRSGDRVSGVGLRDVETGAHCEILASMVVDATGAWAGALNPGAPRLRPLRGSHLVFPPSALPITRAVSWMHPADRRPIFAYPWEGGIVYGTTDLDHEGALDSPRITAAEAAYLIEGLHHQFPALCLSLADAIASYAGVRPVVAGGKAAPSAESRESAMWTAPGLVGVTGGKLTTFRVTARAALREAAKQVPLLGPVAESPPLPVRAEAPARRLLGRLGAAAPSFAAQRPEQESRGLAGTPFTLAEMRWAMRNEQVVHLDDLLLRRTRIGLVTPRGWEGELPCIADACCAELGWDDQRWVVEQRRYLQLWRARHAPEPDAA